MPHFVTRLRVQDYAQWRANWERHQEMRHAGGVRSAQLLHHREDPNEIVLLLEFADHEQGRRWADSEGVREANRLGGVVEATRYFPEP